MNNQLVIGAELPRDVQQDILDACKDRWTVENQEQARQLLWCTVGQPISDEQWLSENAFLIIDGKFTGRSCDMVPARLAGRKTF